MPNLVYIDDAVWAWLEMHPDLGQDWLQQFLRAPGPDDRRIPMYAAPIYETTIRINPAIKIDVEYAITSEWSNTPTLTVARVTQHGGDACEMRAGTIARVWMTR